MFILNKKKNGKGKKVQTIQGVMDQGRRCNQLIHSGPVISGEVADRL